MTARIGAQPGRRTADLLLDQDQLSELVGRPVRATRLRHKPGLSTVAALVPADPEVDTSAVVPWWVQVAEPGHGDKINNAVRRAAQDGLVVHRTTVPGSGLHLIHGTVDTDPRLRKGLRALRAGHQPVESGIATGRWTVLRHNPQRRLVLKVTVPGADPIVLRITATEQPGSDVPAALDALGVPVVRACGRPSEQVSIWPWFGIGDLARVGSTTAAGWAGQALARLHAATVLVGVDHGRHTLAQLEDLAVDLAHLDLSAGDRMAALLPRLAVRLDKAGGPVGPCHGDFSADQVLVDEQGLVRLTDFDRAATGPVWSDLGSFVASAALTGTTGLVEPFLAGYRSGGGSLPTAAALATWGAHARLTRVLEPFRSGQADWAEQVHGRLVAIDEVLR